jgi:hypothetical protein
MYICDDFQFSIRTDLTVNHNFEFETIFAEITHGMPTRVIGHVYRVTNTNEQLSINRYETILRKLATFKWDVMIGTDQNFNYLDIERHGNTRDLLSPFTTNGVIPTITKATRICHSTSTLIDNIYTKFKPSEDISSGILTVDISDHLPVFVLLGKPTQTKRIPKVITYRPMDETKIQNMVNYLDNHSWASLDVENVDDANDTFTKTINYALDRFAPKKTHIEILLENTG